MKPHVEEERGFSGSPDELESAQFRNRLTAIVGEAGGQTSLARAAGVSLSGLQRYLAGSEPSRRNLVKIAQAAGVHVQWLATGEGPVRPGERSVAVVEPEGGPVAHRPAGELGEDFVLLPRYQVRAAAGAGGAIVSEQIVDHLAFRADWIRQRLRRNPADLFLFEIMGDSMEPALRDGDLALADRSVAELRDNAVYALGFEESVVVKRLQRRMNGNVVVISDNPRYPAEEIGPADAGRLRVLGQVVWHAGVL